MHKSLKSLLEQLPDRASSEWPEAEPFTEAFRHGTMSVEVFAPHGVDAQTPHEQDELYIVASGSASFEHRGAMTDVTNGSLLFVPAREEHRFHGMSQDFVTWVVFWGPAGGEGS